MINLKIRRDAFTKIKNNLQYTLLAAFCAEILLLVLKLYVSSFINEDFFYNIQDGILPRFTETQILNFAILLIAIVIIGPIIRLGAIRLFLKLYRDGKVEFRTLFDFVKRPFRAWISYIFVSLLYALWAIIPIALYMILVKFVPFELAIMSVWLMYIPLFYARIRYFAYIYIIADDNKISPLAAARKSAKMLKGNGIILISMVAYFIFISWIFALAEGFLMSMGELGITMILFISLSINTWMHVSLSGLYCFLNGENVGIVVEKINNEDDLKKFIHNNLNMLDKDDNINIPFFKADDKTDNKEELDYEKSKEKNEQDNTEDNDLDKQ